MFPMWSSRQDPNQIFKERLEARKAAWREENWSAYNVDTHNKIERINGVVFGSEDYPNPLWGMPKLGSLLDKKNEILDNTDYRNYINSKNILEASKIFCLKPSMSLIKHYTDPLRQKNNERRVGVALVTGLALIALSMFSFPVVFWVKAVGYTFIAGVIGHNIFRIALMKLSCKLMSQHNVNKINFQSSYSRLKDTGFYPQHLAKIEREIAFQTMYKRELKSIHKLFKNGFIVVREQVEYPGVAKTSRWSLNSLFVGEMQ